MSDEILWFFVAELLIYRIFLLFKTLNDRKFDEDIMIHSLKLWLIKRGCNV